MDLISSRVQSFLGPSLIARSACTAAAEEVEYEAEDEEEEECSRRTKRLSWRARIEQTENMFD